MPDTLQSPSWDPAPFDERDLDAVLGGELADVPVALRPVADALAALRAAPAPAELTGEANAMAQFRALGPGRAAHPAEPAPTLVLPAQPAGPRRAARHRGKRRAVRPARRRTGLLLGSAAVAATVLAAVFTGSVPGPIDRLAHFQSPSTTPSAAHGTRNSSSPKADASSASQEATGASSAAGQSPAVACRTYYGYYQNPQGSSAEVSLRNQLSEMAGSQDPHKLYQYCASYIRDLFKHWSPSLAHDPRPADAGTGAQGAQGGNTGSVQNGGPGPQQNHSNDSSR